MVLLGLDPQRMALRPVGVGEAVAGHRIQSVGPTHFQVLDYIAYGRVFPDLRETLTDYAEDRLSLEALRAALQTYEFVPPDASELQELQQ